jgi:hypothetical protein
VENVDRVARGLVVIPAQHCSTEIVQQIVGCAARTDLLAMVRAAHPTNPQVKGLMDNLGSKWWVDEVGIRQIQSCQAGDTLVDKLRLYGWQQAPIVPSQQVEDGYRMQGISGIM